MGEATPDIMSNPDAILAAAQQEFNVDLKDSGAVMSKGQELANTANRSGQQADHDKTDRLTQLFEAYQKAAGTGQEELQRAA